MAKIYETFKYWNFCFCIANLNQKALPWKIAVKVLRQSLKQNFFNNRNAKNPAPLKASCLSQEIVNTNNNQQKKNIKSNWFKAWFIIWSTWFWFDWTPGILIISSQFRFNGIYQLSFNWQIYQLLCRWLY